MQHGGDIDLSGGRVIHFGQLLCYLSLFAANKLIKRTIDKPGFPDYFSSTMLHYKVGDLE